MSDRHRHGHGFLRPRIPIVNVHIGAADCGTLDLDEHIVVTDRGFRNILHPDTGFRAGLDECFHGLSLVYDAEVACRTTKRGNHLIELLNSVCSIHLGANSRFSMGHDRKGERADVNTSLRDAPGETHGEGSIPQHDGDNRVLALILIETAAPDICTLALHDALPTLPRAWYPG